MKVLLALLAVSAAQERVNINFNFGGLLGGTGDADPMTGNPMTGNPTTGNMTGEPMIDESMCPFANKFITRNTVAGSVGNSFWWPEQLKLDILPGDVSPVGSDFNYAEEFAKLDMAALKADLNTVLTDSQDWWPADFGNYGPFFIRLAWHSAGTYRVGDGRGGGGTGNIRFAPLNSWPDNGNLDKARRLLWPVKKKYGQKISWADLFILIGNVALENMGFQPLGFAAGRADVYEPEEDINWGPETEMLADERHSGDRVLDEPLGAAQMGLIYVNPGGPNGNPDPLLAAHDIRQTFGRMNMNDEEIVALIAGGHTFGKGHGAGPSSNVGPEPEAANIEDQGFGWLSSFGTGNAGDTITSGFEGAWSQTPTQWSNNFFSNLYAFEWELTQTPAGANLWIPQNGEAAEAVPDAHDASQRHPPIMFTTDLALRMDPGFGAISQNFLSNPDLFADAFARAWFKLTHRDMGPLSRYLGDDVPEPQLWQDPVPAGTEVADVAGLKTAILDTGLSTSQLVTTAWASASTYRQTDGRGGANGARIALTPMKDWEVNEPAKLQSVLTTLSDVATNFGASLADVIVIGGCAAVERAASDAGHDIQLDCKTGRGDATQEMTDPENIAPLEPKNDFFRNYAGQGGDRSPAELLLDRASLIGLSAPEMAVLVGGLRVLGANYNDSELGVLTDNVGTLTNDFFVNLLDVSTRWEKDGDNFVGKERVGLNNGGAVKYTATAADLVFGYHSQLRAIAEVYASDDAAEKFANDFGAAFAKVMNADLQ